MGRLPTGINFALGVAVLLVMYTFVAIFLNATDLALWFITFLTFLIFGIAGLLLHAFVTRRSIAFHLTDRIPPHTEDDAETTFPLTDGLALLALGLHFRATLGCGRR